MYGQYINSGPIAKSILQQYDDDMESSYFRRKPTSFLSNSGNAGPTGGGGGPGGGGGGGGGTGLIIGSSATLPAAGDSKRYGGSWLPAEDEAVRLEGPSPNAAAGVIGAAKLTSASRFCPHAKRDMTEPSVVLLEPLRAVIFTIEMSTACLV
uniref:Uncharacterized protein n=1 Tax=Anopheles culicifacies TaxID=139723 RepID=A0A182LSM9_9DIPT